MQGMQRFLAGDPLSSHVLFPHTYLPAVIGIVYPRQENKV